jgi:hypothetical protein
MEPHRLAVSGCLLRIWCSNLAITQEEMRQVHLGKRLDDSVHYSQRTYELDAETTVSALRDVIGGQLNADAKSLVEQPRILVVRSSVSWRCGAN